MLEVRVSWPQQNLLPCYRTMEGSGKISVNGIVENRRGRKLNEGDQIIFANETYIVPNSDPRGRKLE